MPRTITALFDTQDHAEAARAVLEARGIPPGRIRLHPGDVPATSDAPGAEHGLLALFDGLFLPDADRAVFHEGVRRGGTLVTVQAEDAQLDAIRQALEDAGAVDLEARAAAWGRETPPGTTPPTG
jgi:hypothetical protein